MRPARLAVTLSYDANLKALLPLEGKNGLTRGKDYKSGQALRTAPTRPDKHLTSIPRNHTFLT